MSVIEQLEKFINTLEKEAYEVGAGLKEEACFAAIFESAGKLISEETIAELKNADIEHSERAEYLSFLFCMLIDERVKDRTDEVITMELGLEVDTPDGKVPYRQLMIDIANEKSHEKRKALDDVRAEARRPLDEINAEIMTGTYDFIKQYGYTSYLDFFEKLEGVSLTDLKAETQRLLDETSDFYHRELEHYAETFLKMKVKDLSQYDLAYMRRADLFDAMFPAEKLLPAAWDTMDNMGINAKEHPHVHLDIEKRPLKSPRAFCCPVRVPEEVYLVIMPHGGVDDYSSFLHELGHTLHYAHANAGLSVAARYLGDNSVTEAFAGHLEHLIFNKEWLRRRLGIEDASEYLRYMKFFELYMLRRYSGKLHYEMDLHGGKHALAECPRIYAEKLSGATSVDYNPAFYLQDLDSHFYCARYLRAWMLERQVRDKLTKDFGPAWFDERDAGKTLITLWSRGQQYRAEAVSAALGFDSLNFDSFIAEYSR